ncbi:MAG: LytR C-terminal domain-containing protein [Desulfobacterales bacterium]|uniref:LytR C-terminal domain-containing protein n=1 Tax=Candidatus Desulfatibia vada TaxID=2841696 RepID=A0A8J6P2N9_9BACT|nr:LytR C-terminal domain-containing protein [Candidatus Desulfatibia vada]MBL6970704.1 LytR C-terminal domain-containing protein [Desulfobacterales bacterium]
MGATRYLLKCGLDGRVMGGMPRNFSFILLLCLGFIFPGCSGFEYFDGSLKEDTADSEMRKDAIKAKSQKLTTENDELKKQIAIAQEINKRTSISNAKKLVIISERNRSLNQEIIKLQEDNQRIIQENETLKKRLARIKTQDETFVSGFHNASKKDGRLKIKVLSGDGDLNSAEKMAKDLKKIGYRIKSIDYAPRSDFEITTIYFAQNFKDKAKRLKSDLGKNPVLKPLNWSSKFDLIVVTGSQQ